MLYSWMIIAAAMGQTSQPATEPVVTAPVMRVASAADRSTAPQGKTTPERPRSRARDVGVTTRPAAPVRSELPGPGALAADVSELGPLTGDLIDLQATSTGEIIIMANERDLETLSRLIELMDARPPGYEQAFEIFTLELAQAADIAPNVQKLWNEYKKPASGQVRPEDRLTIIHDARANLLMVTTAKVNLPEVEEIIKAMDVPVFGPKDELTFTPILLEHIRAVEAEEVVRDLLKALQDKRGVTKEMFNIKANVRTNSLFVSAPEADLEKIRELIDMIDVPPNPKSGGVVKVAFVPLLKAKAEDLANALNELLATGADKSTSMEEQVRQLQIILAREGGRELSPVNLEKPIKIYFEKGTNSLVIASTEENLEPLLAVVDLLDSAPTADDMIIQVYMLEHADAEAVRENLQAIFDKGNDLVKVPVSEDVKGRTPPGVTSGLVYPICLIAEKRTNTLIVAGRPEQMLVVDRVIKAVDVEEHANRFPVRMIKLEHSDVRRMKDAAQQLAELRKQMAERLGENAAERESVLIIEDVWTNSLVVVANDDNFNEIEDLVTKLDTMGEDWLGEIHIINLPENLAASELSGTIEKLWERRSEIRREGGLPEDKPVLVTDSRSNALIIASNREDYEAINRLIEQLEQQPLTPMLGIYQVRVVHNDVGKVAEIVQKLFEERLKNSQGPNEDERPSDRIFMIDDPMTGMLLIVASKANYDEVVELINKLDVPPPVEGIIETFYVKNIDVEKAEEIINKLFSDGIYRGPSGDRELPESLTKVTIVSDVRSSALIVSASPENYAIVKRILDEIDRVETPIFQTEARFFDVKNADAVNVADLLTQLLEGMRDTLTDQDQLQFKLIPEIRNNRLIVVGTRYAMQRAEELVPELDRAPGGPSSTVKVYEVKKGSAAKIEQVMTRLFKERSSQDQGGDRTPILIIADEASNHLLVTASQDDHKMVDYLLGLLDKESVLSQQMEIISLREAKAEQVANTLADLLGQQKSEFEESYAITPEPRTNSLVVWASPDMMENIKKIVEKIDDSRPIFKMAMRLFKLYNADAEKLAELLTKFFENAGAGEGKDAKQMIIQFIARIDPETGKPITDPKTGEAIMENLVHQDVTIMADPNTNGLLVMAPEANINMLQMLIEMLDSVEPETVMVRPFELHNADATKMKTLLEELFKAEGGDGEIRRIAVGEGAAPTGGGLELAFSVDERTNTLIAAGSPSYLRMVESLVYRLDYQEIDERVVRIVRLNHLRASDVAQTLTDYYEEESQLLEKAAGGQEAATRQLRRQVTVTEAGQGEDRESNVLLVSYSPHMESQVLRMIQELDQPVPQVMIQVLMAEVTLTDNFELGMEFAMQDLLFSEKATLNPNTGLPQGGDFDFVFGTDVGAIGSGGLGGLSFTMGGEDFNFLFRALQTEGRVEVLSRPSIMVEDGKEAEIVIGDNVPIVDDIAVGVGGVVQPSVTYKDVGIMLKVLPVINPDNYVSMHIEPEISAIGQSNISIGAGVTLPIFTKRNAITDVMVKDGETIIIGGLITSRENNSESKVPLAGDVPVFGNLFRSTSKSTTKTELLFVLTPHVVRVAEDARAISEQMRDQTGLNQNIRTSPLMQKLQVTEDGGEFGPAVLPEKPSAAEESKRNDGGDEMGPELEEYGPDASTIRTGPIQPAVARYE